jgi:pimeloyl-ACP methyl ester carboxylesterase
MNQPTWTGTLPVDDTELYVSDTGGPGRPVVYLNGAYADQKHWKRVITELGSDYRHITYDERARGKSKRSKDYSFEACLRDLDAVLKARGVERPPLLVGWSYGGVLSWHWTDRNPDRVAGVVTVDAFPVGLTGEAGRERIRKLFRQWRLVLPIARQPHGARPSSVSDSAASKRFPASSAPGESTDGGSSEV